MGDAHVQRRRGADFLAGLAGVDCWPRVFVPRGHSLPGGFTLDFEINKAANEAEKSIEASVETDAEKFESLKRLRRAEVLAQLVKDQLPIKDGSPETVITEAEVRTALTVATTGIMSALGPLDKELIDMVIALLKRAGYIVRPTAYWG
jgi:hypothetical protein